MGELGYELYINFEDAKEIYNEIMKNEHEFNISNCGMHAMDIMRMESGFVHWGHDISPEENQFEAGLNFAVSFKKNINFIGRDVLEKIKDKKVEKSLKILKICLVMLPAAQYFQRYIRLVFLWVPKAATE